MVDQGQRQTENELVVVGRISGLFGVQGWVKVFSHTRPRENILQYQPWYLAAKETVVNRGTPHWVQIKLVSGRIQGKGIIVQLDGFTDRDAAAGLIGKEIAILRSQLPVLAQDEYYWSDLIGLKVVTDKGVSLGVVTSLMETGVNDVLVVKGEREHLIPYIRDDVVKSIDLSSGVVTVDWDPEF
jgi:16S rRNA processing protein RimM